MTSTLLATAETLMIVVDRMLSAAGATNEEARIVAESLVDADLRGHASHGVVRVLDYVPQMQANELRGGAELTILNETHSLIAADAGFGFGQVQCRRLIERLEPKARGEGVACGTLKNSGHVGRLGEWVDRIAARGLAALMSVNDNGVLQCVAPPGGKRPRISTNPFALGAPTSGAPMSIDLSTSAVANGKVKVALLSGQPCPPGWLLDAEGNPTNDPSTRFSETPGSILPMGGEQGYKGFGLGLLLDMLVGGLSGGNCPPAPAGDVMTNNVLLVMWDPERFAGRAHFAAESTKLERYVRDAPLRDGVDEIRLPGDRSNRLRKERQREGIPLDRGTWDALNQLAATLNVTLPDIAS